MATWFAVYDSANANVLMSIGSSEVQPSVPAPLVAVSTAFSDGVTPTGSQPDLQLVVWNPVTLVFDLRPPRVKDSEELAIEALIQKQNNLWDTADIARALKALLRKLIIRAD